MKHISKIFIISILFVLSINTAFAAADTSDTSDTSLSIPCPLPQELCDARSAISYFTALILPIAALLLLGIIIYGGFTKLTAAGDAEKEKKAMAILKNAIIGFIIIALAGIIVATLGGLFGFKVLSNN